MLVIDPDQCIDCGLCEPACPIEAIVSEDEIPESQKDLFAINQRYAQTWPNITKAKPTSFDTAYWQSQSNKVHLIEDIAKK